MESSIITTDKLLYDIGYFDSIHDAQATFEQNKHGEHIQVNKWKIYLSTNTDGEVVVWWDSNICYSLYGMISQEDLIQIIQMINKGET